MRARMLAWVGIAVVGLVAMEAPVGARPRCHLTGSNLVRSRVMKVVDRVASDGTERLVGCVYSVGRAHCWRLSCRRPKPAT
jgi:hypothetical protein